LDRLVSQVEVNNQNVAAALAAYDQTQTLIREAQSGFFPTVSGNYSGLRAGDGKAVGASGQTVATTTFYPQLTGSWTQSHSAWTAADKFQVLCSITVTVATLGRKLKSESLFLFRLPCLRDLSPRPPWLLSKT